MLQTLIASPAMLDAEKKLLAARDKYADDAKDIQKEARAKDDETALEERRALRFDIGEGLLELGLLLPLFPGAQELLSGFRPAGRLCRHGDGRLGLPALMAAARVRRVCAAAPAALGVLFGALAVLLAAAADQAAVAAAPAPAARVEARSADFLAVGLVRDGVMTIHLSRLLDNAPLHDALLTVNLRGAALPATAEADGSYSVKHRNYRCPGPPPWCSRSSKARTRSDCPASCRSRRAAAGRGRAAPRANTVGGR